MALNSPGYENRGRVVNGAPYGTGTGLSFALAWRTESIQTVRDAVAQALPRPCAAHADTRNLSKKRPALRALNLNLSMSRH